MRPFPLVALAALVFFSASALAAGPTPAPTSVPLPGKPLSSWLEAAPKQAIGRFAKSLGPMTGDETSGEAARIAVFATENVLWDAGPVPLETSWALDRLRRLAPTRPAWLEAAPFAGALGGDASAVAALSPADVARLNAAAVAGLEQEEVRRSVLDWARAEREGAPPVASLARAPVRELLVFLRTWGFRSCVLSDGPADVTRALVEALYGLPPHRVIAPASPLEVRPAPPALRVVHADTPSGPPSGNERLLLVAQQAGARPFLVALADQRDAPLLSWAAATRPFLGLVFFGTRADPRGPDRTLRSDLPLSLWSPVVPIRHWKASKPAPRPSPAP